MSTGAYSGYSEYFHNKELQQLESDLQFRSKYQRDHNIAHPTLFQNCIIYVNGRTVPSRLQLHKLVILHGGTFKHYLSAKSAVTHIIASELNASKKISLANAKVVLPEWITESIARGKLLPWQDFRTIKTSRLQGQITDFATVQNCMDPNFIASFFKASRLHHLSNWKAQLRDQFVKQLFDDQGTAVAPHNSSNNNKEYVYFHVDFDCFFAQVSAKVDGKYDIHTTPIAISHGIKNSDISSCNYVARSFGVHNGMWVSSALKLCPDLKILDYEFDEYEVVSSLFYKALRETNLFDMVLPISVDEAICCMALESHITAEYLAKACDDIRSSVYKQTHGYTVSIGCASSVLLARLALRKGKPNGSYVAWFDNDDDKTRTHSFIDQFNVKDLPGIGYSTNEKIQQEFGSDIATVSDLRQCLQDVSGLSRLTKRIGSKNTKKLETYLNGNDDDETLSMVKDPRAFFQKKSLSVEVNYAIRFKTIHEADTFLERLSQYLCDKLKDTRALTRQVTLKLMKRAAGAPVEPPKFMGMGRCDAVSKSSTLGASTDKHGTIASECKTLFRLLSVPPTEVRGVGIQFHKLTGDPAQQQQQQQQGVTKNDIALDLLQKRRARSEEVVAAQFDVDPHTPPAKSIANSPIKNYWDRHLKRSVTPFEYDFPEELDPEFMSNLPKEVQEEVLLHHKVAKRAKKSLRSKVNGDPQKQIKQTQDLHFIHDGRLVPPLSFQGLKSVKQVSKTLVDWVDATIEAGPHDKDLQLFMDYLEKLADQGRSHIILQLIKTIKTRIEDHYSMSQATTSLENWEFLLLRKLVPILNRTRSDVDYNLVFDL